MNRKLTRVLSALPREVMTKPTPSTVAGCSARVTVRAVVVTALLVLLAALAGATGARADSGTTVTVMTQNLYFGADLTPVIQTTTPTGFFAAVTAAYNQGVASDWNGRAMQWANEIAAAKPDLVGLQEAAQWRTQFPSDFSPIPDATTVAADFVNLLVTDLAALGVPYTVAAADTGYDVEAPGSFPGPFPLYTDVRVTQHDVILARQESRLKVSNPQAGQYQARITIPTVVGIAIPLPWAWASVDASVGGHTFRFATTHLDSISGAAQVAQAQEFLTGAGSTTLPLVWAGDFNSDADATTVTGIVPDTATYQNIVTSGLTDTWAAVNPGDPGYTCCEGANLDNPQPTLDERIDHVFTRGPWQAVNVTIVGASPADKTASNLWPSDHAGIVAKLNLRGQS
jgi:endonuclease/exonuclease/phosphatase family metal-dependent hydrolase